MSLGDIKKRQSIISAIELCKDLGPEQFRNRYGLGKARSYFLLHDGVKYDSKPIIGAAHEFEFGMPLRKFSGGERTVQRKLEELGFKVLVNVDRGKHSIDELKPGSILNNRELMKKFSVGISGGMRRSRHRNHLVVVSDHTKTLYDDHWDGATLHYTGMGKSGDQTLNSQNRTIAESKTNGVKLFLFEVFHPGRYIFHGEVALAATPYKDTQPDEKANLRKVWMFPLRLLAPHYEPTITASDIQNVQKIRQKALKRFSVEQLRKRASASTKKPARRLSQVEQIIRSEDVAAYAKKAAGGKCDLCEQKAPFLGKEKEPFLECHHVEHLADGGDDTIENAVGLCPNCHRKMHVLGLAVDRKKLLERIQKREKLFSNHLQID